MEMKNRFNKNLEKYFELSDEQYKKLKRFFEAALDNIIDDIENFNNKYGELTEEGVNRLLNPSEVKQLQRIVANNIREAKALDLDPEYIERLEETKARVRVSRLEGLHYQINHELELLTATRGKLVVDMIEEISKDSYYRNMYELNKIGYSDNFKLLDLGTIQKLIDEPWAEDRKSIYNRLVRDKKLLQLDIDRELGQMFITGENPKRTANRISKNFGTGYKATQLLFENEAAYYMNQSKIEAYKAMNVKEVIYIATLDDRTTLKCQGLDAKVIPINELEVGVNCPPTHVRCRSTIAPHFKGNLKERAARDPITGKTIMIPFMSYGQWYKTYVKGDKNEGKLSWYKRRG